MTILTRAAYNLATRAPEEHFPSMEAITAHAVTQRARSRNLYASDATVAFNPVGLSIRHGVPTTNETLVLGSYAWEQVAAVCGVPVDALSRMTPDTRVRALNETWRPDHDEKDPRAWLVEDTDQGPLVRCTTSAKYERVWDADILQSVDRWLLADGRWVPAYPEKNTDEKGTNTKGNTKPALFRSDRDSFVFFMGERDRGDGGSAGLRRGLYVWNSEVGTTSFGFSTFLFDAMCANFLIWGAKGVRTQRARHVGTVATTWQNLTAELQRASEQDLVTDAELRTIELANQRPFLARLREQTNSWEDDAVAKLRTAHKVSGQTARRALEAMLLPENAHRTPGSVWAVVSGLTSYAKELPYASQRLALQKTAGQVLVAETA